MAIFRKLARAVTVLAVAAGSAFGQGPAPCNTATVPGANPCDKAKARIEAPRWERTADMNVARGLHSATLLADGKVLVAGGRGASGVLDSAELYDPATGAWTVTGKMNWARESPTATLLPDGRVLLFGGMSKGGTPRTPYDLFEIYDPSTGGWTAGGHTTNADWRYGHSATLLDSGDVLLVGGWSWNEDPADRSYLYDSADGDVRVIGGPASGRAWHQATLLPDGRVLITGGHFWNDAIHRDAPAASALAFDAAAAEWTAAGTLAHARTEHTATPLRNGTVLVVGGGSRDAELFDPVGDRWSDAGTLDTDRSRHTASLLRSGAVLVAGGTQNGNASTSAELYQPESAQWTASADLNVARAWHTATVLRDGRVLVTGGFGIGANYPPLDSAEIFQYMAATPAATVVEYRNTLDFVGSPGGHYFYTDDPAELALLDAGAVGRFARTGREFKSGGSKQLCRFFGSTAPGPNSHFYTIDDAECAALKAAQQSPPPHDLQQWNYEGLRFAQEPPLIDAAGTHCPAGTLPVYRGYNNAYTTAGTKNAWDSVHRFSTNRADIQQMVKLFGWREEGMAFCSPQ